MNFKHLLDFFPDMYFLYAQHQYNSSDDFSTKELIHLFTNYPIIEHYYQVGDSIVNPDGYPRPEAISKDEFIILVGGPSAQPCVKYYEDTKQAPIIQKWTDTHIWWETRDGKIADETFTPRVDLDEHHDMFIIEFFKDDYGRSILIYYGHNWQGTLVAGLYFSKVLYPKISSCDRSYYIFRWVDSNNDAFPDVSEVIGGT